jgi:hypothetical protein
MGHEAGIIAGLDAPSTSAHQEATTPNFQTQDGVVMRDPTFALTFHEMVDRLQVLALKDPRAAEEVVAQMARLIEDLLWRRTEDGGPALAKDRRR